MEQEAPITERERQDQVLSNLEAKQRARGLTQPDQTYNWLYFFLGFVFFVPGILMAVVIAAPLEAARRHPYLPGQQSEVMGAIIKSSIGTIVCIPGYLIIGGIILGSVLGAIF